MEATERRDKILRRLKKHYEDVIANGVPVTGEPTNLAVSMALIKSDAQKHLDDLLKKAPHLRDKPEVKEVKKTSSKKSVTEEKE